MAVRIPPKVQENLPKPIGKTIGAINNLQGRTRSLTASINNIHNINDALNALDEVKGFVGALFPAKSKSPNYGKVMKEVSGDYVHRNVLAGTYPTKVSHTPNPTKFNTNLDSQFSLDKFLSIINANSLAKTNKFRVRIFGLATKIYGQAAANVGLSNQELEQAAITVDLDMLCESAEFPGRNLEFTDAITYGPVYKMPYASNYQEINLTFLCNKNLAQKKVFDDWMDFINPSYSFDFSYRNDYVVDIGIYHFDDLGNATYGIMLKEAYPTTVQPLTASWSDDQFHKLQVTMSYRYWEEILMDNTANVDSIDISEILSPRQAQTTINGDPPTGAYAPGQTNTAYNEFGESVDG